ncbi:hypothetical protein MAPG_06519 [Magnaporthiopsis poae ATCC 64411]|uniref:Uncharacterized protein n=1 Tax=Magnaporthiopsis poae (strain ATCC 64411 / 73-15) TaxID=644358 RepID=A0A0C4E290_MAGP6|nr:hypothetical protein MAPG_06519 [Magnaporthiopsis poae ATCC 64411]
MFRFIVPNYTPATRLENPTSRPANDNNKQPHPGGMSDDVYRRVGRGGAGNFYSKKDVEDVEKASKAAIDLEAQKTDPSSLEEAAPAPAQYSRAGRGGAGNFYEGGGAGSSDDSAEARRVQALVGASLAQPKQGAHGGRGGMGNWSSDSGTTAQAQGDERARMSLLQAKILKDVDAGLAPPPKTYHQSDRDVE